MTDSLIFQHQPSSDPKTLFSVTLSHGEVIECPSAEQASNVVANHMERGKPYGIHHTVVSAVTTDPAYRS